MLIYELIYGKRKWYAYSQDGDFRITAAEAQIIFARFLSPFSPLNSTISEFRVRVRIWDSPFWTLFRICQLQFYSGAGTNRSSSRAKLEQDSDFGSPMYSAVASSLQISISSLVILLMLDIKAVFSLDVHGLPRVLVLISMDLTDPLLFFLHLCISNVYTYRHCRRNINDTNEALALPLHIECWQYECLEKFSLYCVDLWDVLA